MPSSSSELSASVVPSFVFESSSSDETSDVPASSANSSLPSILRRSHRFCQPGTWLVLSFGF
jgi:hypothetical protein